MISQTEIIGPKLSSKKKNHHGKETEDDGVGCLFIKGGQ